jgi:hypothetical protein
VELEFSGEIFYWRGPSPWYFVTVPDAGCAELEAASPEVSYGWGMIPAVAQLGELTFRTSLFRKDGGYAVPIKAAVRRSADIDDGDTVTLRLTVDI